MEPRVVEITYDLPDGFYSTALYPVALTVCQESRKALLPHYALCFGTIFHPPKTRFNFSLDTLYLDNSFEEDVPHLFGAMGERELKGLRYVALDSYFNGSDNNGEFEFVVHLRRAMRCLKSLRELQIVFDVQVMTNRTLGCGQEDHAMEIHEFLPKELQLPQLKISALPEDIELDEVELWKVPKVKPVYGWRRCPIGLENDSWSTNMSIWDPRYERHFWRNLAEDSDETDGDEWQINHHVLSESEVYDGHSDDETTGSASALADEIDSQVDSLD
jgi:hypothetical protein